ncbi:ABC transporter permease [Roseococcus sp.]|uniref:ABC transporter permease n=1 Tax=Roseococcus sp. TaxID=2109646 RepID=UPI003BA93BD9
MWAGRLLLLGLALGLWEALPRLGWVDDELLPPFSAVLETLFELLRRPAIRGDLATTAMELTAAILISVPTGIFLGILLAENQRLARVCEPLVFFLFSVPKSIFLPLFILTMGIGFWQKVAFGCFSTILIVLMSATAAIRSVRGEHVLVARSYGATRAQITRHVYLPSMLPVLLEALRLAVIFATTAVVLAEMYASRTGIGQQIASWGEGFMMRQLFAGVLLISTTAILINEAIRWIETRCSHWRN